MYRGAKMNYYVPISSGEAPAEVKRTPSSSSEPRYTPRILARRFPLTPTASKYMEIGINVGGSSFVELLIGDNRGNRIILPHTTWETFIERRADIEQLVQSANASSISIRDLRVELVPMRDGERLVKLTSCDTSLWMKVSTILFIFNIEQCVEHVYYSLCQNIQSVNEKFTQFVTALRRNCITDKCNAANVLRTVYDCNSIIDCELLAYALDVIICNAK